MSLSIIQLAPNKYRSKAYTPRHTSFPPSLLNSKNLLGDQDTTFPLIYMSIDGKIMPTVRLIVLF